MYAGNEVVDIWEGVRLGLRVLRGLSAVVVFLALPPASCSAVSSRAPAAGTGVVAEEAAPRRCIQFLSLADLFDP